VKSLVEGAIQNQMPITKARKHEKIVHFEAKPHCLCQWLYHLVTNFFLSSPGWPGLAKPIEPKIISTQAPALFVIRVRRGLRF
jgi:hypothetical protein